MAVQVKVRERAPGPLRPGLNTGLVCEDTAAEGCICANAALYVNVAFIFVYNKTTKHIHIYRVAQKSKPLSSIIIKSY